MSKDINYLLRKYSVKQPGEVWDSKTERKYVKDYEFKERIFLFETLNGNFLNGGEKDRMIYLLKHFDFDSMGSVSDEDTIMMMMLYIKLEKGKKNIGQYEYYLEKYNIPKNRFITFLIKMARYYANKSYL